MIENEMGLRGTKFLMIYTRRIKAHRLDGSSVYMGIYTRIKLSKFLISVELKYSQAPYESMIDLSVAMRRYRS
jgi:hypothetical protein